MGKVIDHFSQYLKDLTYAEKHVLYFIEENLEQVKNESLTKLAEQNNVSTTTIIRLCRKLNLEGFSELKYVLKSLDPQTTISPDHTLERYQTVLDQMFSSLSAKYFEEISEIINRSNQIIIISVGLTKTIGEYFSKLFMQVNKYSTYLYESHMIDLIPKSLKPNDLVVYISSSGETKTIIQAAEKIRFKNVRTLAITNNSDSTLSKIAHYNLSVNVERNQFFGYDITPRSTLVMLIDILFEFYLKEISK